LELVKKLEKLSHFEKAKILETLCQKEGVLESKTVRLIERVSTLEGFAKFDALRKLRRHELKKINRATICYRRLFE
jgi:hypothetical protein